MFTKIPQFSLLVLMLFLSVLEVAAQELNSKQILEKGWGVPEVPLNCETNFVRLEQTRDLIRTQKNKNGVLILIARFGDGEKRRELNRRRLDNISKGLSTALGLVEKIITAEGEPIKGFGRVEFYLGGEMIGALLAKKNSDIYVSCEAATNYKNFNLVIMHSMGVAQLRRVYATNTISEERFNGDD